MRGRLRLAEDPRARLVRGEAMSAQHTPGPWIARAWRTHSWTTITREVNGEAVPIAEVDAARPGYLSDPETIANARLIAAAPDLLNGCRALLGLVQLVSGRDDLPADLREALRSNHRIAEAEAAIAKATT
jgi:hypothetical protein